MINISFDDKKFYKKMTNLVAYSNGFVEGAKRSKPEMLNILGEQVSEIMGKYIDSMASANPTMLHHVYEWGQTGSASARLFDIDYISLTGGLTMSATLTQSKSIQAGSNVPFYNKARIMESGIPVTIAPKSARALAFDVNGESVFTKKPVTVSNPGGVAVQGKFEDTFDEFFQVYLSQSIFDVTGLGNQIRNSKAFKQNLSRGVSGGKSVGLAAGRQFVIGGKL